jgi:hypothetical protein
MAKAAKADRLGAAIGTSRLGGIFGGPLPGPATLDLGFEGETKKGSNRHDAR